MIPTPSHRFTIRPIPKASEIHLDRFSHVRGLEPPSPHVIVAKYTLRDVNLVGDKKILFYDSLVIILKTYLY